MRNLARIIFITFFTITLAFTVSCTSITTEGTSEMTTIQTTENTDTSTDVEVTNISFERVEVMTEEIKVDQMLELALFENDNTEKISDNYNPYDYHQIKVVVTFVKPSGDTHQQTAFWYQDYEEVRIIGEQISEDGFYTSGQEYITWGNLENHYRVRINPDETGLWEYSTKIILEDKILDSLSGSFDVLENTNDSKGYIQVDQTNHRNFIFSKSNETYIPMGVNLGWPSTTLSTHDYYNWFKHLNENNSNMARVWLANWSFSLHKYDIDNFDSRQNKLARLDYLFETAQQFDMYIMLTLINHGQFSSITNPEWAENPYNSENGGMLDYPIQFFYNEEAIEVYKNELMYIISRFGYSENIFAWELFNETDWVDGYSSQIVTRWKDIMASFLHENDPYNHLVTTSYKYTWGTPGFDLESLDFCTFHSYEFGNAMYYEKMVDELTNLWDKYQKPVLFGEVGIDWVAGDSTYSSDYLGITIRQGLWGGLLSSAGGANQWWWDSWIDRNNLWDRFLGASTYATYMDLANKSYTLIQENELVQTSDEDLKVIGYILDHEMYGYIYNNMWNYWNDNLEEIQNISVSIPFTNGDYTLYAYDTSTGELITQESVSVTNGLLIIEHINILEDYAFIVR